MMVAHTGKDADCCEQYTDNNQCQCYCFCSIRNCEFHVRSHSDYYFFAAAVVSAAAGVAMAIPFASNLP